MQKVFRSSPGVPLGWRRREFTTRGADPTVVVEWSYQHAGYSIRLTEFQSVIQVEINGVTIDNPLRYWEQRHSELEAAWQQVQLSMPGDPGRIFGGA